MGRRLIVGDIHSHLEKLKQALDRANFCPETDTLYSVGDLCDRGPDPVGTLSFLYSLPHFYPVLGNHDLWLLQNFHKEQYKYDSNWICNNGGEITLKGIARQSGKWCEDIYQRLLYTPYSRILDNYIIVHGGLNLDFLNSDLSALDGVRPIDIGIYTDEYHRYSRLCWDRTYIKKAQFIASKKQKKALDVSTLFEIVPWNKELIIGHTPIKNAKPFFCPECKLIAIDTGSYLYKGRLTVMDIDSKEYWQSDNGQELGDPEWGWG